MAVDVAEEGLEAVVDHLDGLAGAQRQQAGVDLHRQVLAAAEGAADAGERHADLLLGQAEDGGDLPQVGVEPLGGDVQVDAAVLGGHREPRLGAEERLVLHAEDVFAGDHDVGPGAARRDVAVDDGLAVHDVRVRGVRGVVVVAALVEQGRAGGGGTGLVGDEGQFLVDHLDLGRRAAGRLGVVGGDQGDRLAVVADPAVGEGRGVLDLQAVVLHLGGQVVVGEDRVDPCLGQGLAGVDGDDAGVGVRGAQGVPPQHVLVPHVGGVRELTGDLEGAVGPQRRLADAPAGGGALGEVARDAGGGHRLTVPSWRAAARRTASRIFS